MHYWWSACIEIESCVLGFNTPVLIFVMVKLFSQVRNFTFQNRFSARNITRTPTKLTKIAASSQNV